VLRRRGLSTGRRRFGGSNYTLMLANEDVADEESADEELADEDVADEDVAELSRLNWVLAL
jgi:hypothetical protein